MIYHVATTRLTGLFSVTPRLGSSNPTGGETILHRYTVYILLIAQVDRPHCVPYCHRSQIGYVSTCSLFRPDRLSLYDMQQH